jgi:hypothetical protein
MFGISTAEHDLLEVLEIKFAPTPFSNSLILQYPLHGHFLKKLKTGANVKDKIRRS